MDIRSPSDSEYRVGPLVGETQTARLYLVTQAGTKRSCLMQLAKDVGGNGVLDRMGFILGELQAKAAELEESWKEDSRYAGHPLNTAFGFPELVDGFLFTEQGNRRINVLGFNGVSDVRELVPLENIASKDRRRVDLRTSAWILGKAIKLLAFAHDSGFAMGDYDMSSVLIQPTEHYVVLFDWSRAQTFTDPVPAEQCRAEIMRAARSVVTLLGGDQATRSFPNDGEPGREQYLDHVLQLAAGSRSDAHQARKEHYALLRELDWKGFHPFTSVAL